MTSAFPPQEHNPHEWAAMHPDVDVVVGHRELAVAGEQGPELVDLPAGQTIVGETGPEPVDPAQLAALAETNPVEDNTPDPVGGDTPPLDEDANVDVNGDGRIDGYELFTKPELVSECERRGLSTTGNKPDLVRRLQEADASRPQE